MTCAPHGCCRVQGRCLGPIFLRYISDAFRDRYQTLKTEKYADPEDRDEYTAQNVFWVPKQARWQHLQARAPEPAIGKLVDNAMSAIGSPGRSTTGQDW